MLGVDVCIVFVCDGSNNYLLRYRLEWITVDVSSFVSLKDWGQLAFPNHKI